jgi:hypothetical protein
MAELEVEWYMISRIPWLLSHDQHGCNPIACLLGVYFFNRSYHVFIAQVRLNFGPIALTGLAVGECRELTPSEVEAFRQQVAAK